MPGFVNDLMETAKGEMPKHVYEVTSMLSWEERALLYGLARHHFRGHSYAVVDAGCFVGGSTLALASGLAARGGISAGIIHSYDRLLLEPYSRDGYFPELQVGDSLRPIFDHNLAEYRNLVNLHEGDILQETWCRPFPIDILFIDLAKSWELNNHVARTFFPFLRVGSVVIQQDLVHWEYPWIAIMMEALASHFENLGWVWYASSVWRVTRTISRNEVDVDWRHAIGLERGLELLERAAMRTDGVGPALLSLARPTLCIEYSQPERAVAELEQIARRYGTDTSHMDEGYAHVRQRLSGLAKTAPNRF